MKNLASSDLNLQELNTAEAKDTNGGRRIWPRRPRPNNRPEHGYRIFPRWFIRW